MLLLKQIKPRWCWRWQGLLYTSLRMRGIKINQRSWEQN